ncbi:transglutaminase-like superfamily protein [Striga asiatica]|uniref:Transglutaminase-like superfamily protein n=1 Tax=Striga asiatica TaxID=4170 RepID=A0A5A7PXH7_STRAF|nr:transglutaminase-like superfamily protein [Striga asiatica]
MFSTTISSLQETPCTPFSFIQMRRQSPSTQNKHKQPSKETRSTFQSSFTFSGHANNFTILKLSSSLHDPKHSTIRKCPLPKAIPAQIRWDPSGLRPRPAPERVDRIAVVIVRDNQRLEAAHGDLIVTETVTDFRTHGVKLARYVEQHLLSSGRVPQDQDRSAMAGHEEQAVAVEHDVGAALAAGTSEIPVRRELESLVRRLEEVEPWEGGAGAFHKSFCSLDRRSCSRRKSESEEMVAFNHFDTAFNLRSDLTGNLPRISRMTSSGRGFRYVADFFVCADADIMRNRLAISVKEGRKAGFGAQHCSINALHSASQ